MQILEVCYKSGVRVVTIYAFSIENFKRSKYEVDALMDMAKVKLTQLAQHGALLERYQAKIQILGDQELVRPDVLEAINKAVDMTKSHDQYVLRS
jgi:ditrans,polycis-polyprenyl diphosphate synthase